MVVNEQHLQEFLVNPNACDYFPIHTKAQLAKPRQTRKS